MTRERTFVPEQGGVKKRSWKPLIFLPLLAAAVAGIHLSGGAQYLYQERLRELIAASGTLAPAIYIRMHAPRIHRLHRLFQFHSGHDQG